MPDETERKRTGLTAWTENDARRSPVAMDIVAVLDGSSAREENEQECKTRLL